MTERQPRYTYRRKRKSKHKAYVRLIPALLIVAMVVYFGAPHLKRLTQSGTPEAIACGHLESADGDAAGSGTTASVEGICAP